MSLKRISLAIVILSVIFFTIISLLSIWEVEIFEDREFVWKSLGSLAVVAFAGLVGIVISERIDKISSQ